MATQYIGIDIGGTGIKGAIVDVDQGAMISDRMRVATPSPATPEAVAGAMSSLVKTLEHPGPIGVGFPAVIKNGVAGTANNIHETWIGTHVAHALQERVDRDLIVVNDADAAGLAEATFGAARGVNGKVLVLTFGTGIGSAVIFDGQLIPNFELGNLEFEGVAIAEDRFSAKARETFGLSWEEWGTDIGRFTGLVQRVVNADLIVFGGGAVKKWDKFADQIPTDLPVVRAQLLNSAGIVGAALVASREGHTTDS